MSSRVLEQIQELLPTFSKSQRRIADFVSSHYEKASFMTASALGEAVSVSESTVVRFATELGFDGYPAFKHALREITKNKLTAVQRLEITSQRLDNENLLDAVLGSDIDKIRITLEELDRVVFAKAVDAITTAKRIYIIGVRSSSALARFLSFYFNHIFENVAFIETTSASEMFERIMRIDEGDVLIGISFPRYSARVSKAFSYAKSRGATAIAITDSIASPLAENADYALLAKSDMASFVDSLVAPLSLINALIVAVSMKKQDEVAQSLITLEHIWQEYDVYQNSESQHDKL